MKLFSLGDTAKASSIKRRETGPSDDGSGVHPQTRASTVGALAHECRRQFVRNVSVTPAEIRYARGIELYSVLLIAGVPYVRSDIMTIVEAVC